MAAQCNELYARSLSVSASTGQKLPDLQLIRLLSLVRVYRLRESYLPYIVSRSSPVLFLSVI